MRPTRIRDFIMKKLLSVLSLFFLTFVFCACDPEYTITLSVSQECTSMGTVTGGGKFKDGTTTTIVATPNNGYYFVKWDDGNTEAVRSITVTSNRHYTAYFSNGDPTPNTDPGLKTYLENTAVEFMNLNQSNDFNNLQYFIKDMVDLYEDYDFDVVGEWAESIIKGLRSFTGTETESHYYYTEYFDNYNLALMVSQFTGHFVADAQKETWVKSNANDLQFTAKDKQGNTCVLKVVASGSTKTVNVGTYSDYRDYYQYCDYYDNYNTTIAIPENINVTLTRGGNQVVAVELHFDLTSISNNEYIFNSSSLNYNSKVTLNNGYVINVSQVKVAPTNVAVKYNITKNSTELIDAIVTSDVSNIPSLKVSELIDEGDDDDFENVNGTNAYVQVTFINKLRMNGTFTNIRNIIKRLEDADDNRYSESTVKSDISQVNTYLNCGIYYQDLNTKRASLKFEVFSKQSYNNQIKWYYEPVIVFSDGTNYSTFTSFFNEDDFRSAINTFEDLLDDYERMIED